MGIRPSAKKERFPPTLSGSRKLISCLSVSRPGVWSMNTGTAQKIAPSTNATVALLVSTEANMPIAIIAAPATQ